MQKWMIPSIITYGLLLIRCIFSSNGYIIALFFTITASNKFFTHSADNTP